MVRKQFLPKLLAALCVSTVLLTCDHDSGPADNGDVKTQDAAAFVGRFAGVPWIDAFRDRFANRTNSVSKAKIVVIDGAYTGDLGNVRTAYNNDAVIAVLKATGDQLAALYAALGARPGFEGGTPADIVAFNKHDTHHAAFLSGHSTSTGKRTTTYIKNEAEQKWDVDPTEKLESSPPEPLEPFAGTDAPKYFDQTVAWLDRHNDGYYRQKLRGTGGAGDDASDITTLINSQEVTMTFNYQRMVFSGDIDSGDHYWDGTSSVVSVVYHIWPFWDITNQHDYYVVKQEITLPNDSMPYWSNYKDSDKWVYTGYYFYSFYTDHYPIDNVSGQTITLLKNDDEVILEEYGPLTSIGAQTVGTNVTSTWGGQFGFSGMGGAGNVSHSLSYSDSTSSTIKDAEAECEVETMNTSYFPETPKTANARWEYKLKNFPVFKNEDSFYYPHKCEMGPAPDIAHYTATFDNSWVWHIKKPADHTKLGSTWSFQIGIATTTVGAHSYGFADWYGGDSGSWVGWNDKGFDNIHNNRIVLTPPPRVDPPPSSAK